jgi:predicted flavoprotein YhiN
MRQSRISNLRTDAHALVYTRTGLDGRIVLQVSTVRYRQDSGRLDLAVCVLLIDLSGTIAIIGVRF